MFYFGDIPRESRVGGFRFGAPEEEVLLFFSRRIGLTNAGQEIPIAAGGRRLEEDVEAQVASAERFGGRSDELEIAFDRACLRRRHLHAVEAQTNQRSKNAQASADAVDQALA